MKKRFTEEWVIFISVIKWFVLASIIGVFVGFASTIFIKTLEESTAFITHHYSYYFFLLPIAFFLSSLIIKYLAPEAEGHGTEKVIEAVHKRFGKINVLVIPVKLVASVITVAIGGSAGKEGPCAQIGGGIASAFAGLFKFDNNDRRKLVICGISAGFASVFGTPIAGAIFGIEVLVVGVLSYDVLLPSFIAGMMAFEVASKLGITYFHNPITFVPVFSEIFLLKVALSGVFFGVCSFILIEVLKFSNKLSEMCKIWKPLKGLIGGLIIVGLTLIFSKQYLGLGLETIQSSLQGEKVVWYAFLVKIIFTCVTLNFGGSGGILTPIFFIGATSGAMFGGLLGIDTATFSAIGFVSLLSGAANTPIAASIMAVEIFGPTIAPYAAIACVISFFMTGHRSVYPSQVLAIQKSQSIHVEVGKEVEHARARYKPRRKSITRISMRIAERIKRLPKKSRHDTLHKTK